MHDYRQFLAAAGRMTEGIELLNQAIEQDLQAHPPVAPRYLAHWQRLLGENYIWMSQMTRGDDYLRGALATLGKALPQNDWGMVGAIAAELAKQTAHRTLPQFFIGRQEDNQAALEDAIVAYRALGTRAVVELDNLAGMYCTLRGLNLSEAARLSALMAETYGSIGMMMALMPWSRGAEYYLSKAERLVEEEQNVQARGMVLTLIGTYHCGLGVWEKGHQYLQRGAEVLERLSQGWWLGTNYAICSFLALQVGNYERSLHYARLFGDLGYDHGDPGFIVADLYWRALVELRRNRLELAHDYLQKSAAAPAEVMNRFDWLVVYAAQAMVYLRLNEKESAAGEVQKCLALLDGVDRPTHPLSLAGYSNLAQACLALWAVNPGGADEGSSRAQAEVVCKELQKAAKIFPIGRPTAHLHQGSFYWLDGRRDQALQSWRKSLTLAEELEMPYEQALAHYELGRNLLENDQQAAQDHLAQTRRIFHDLGIAGDLALNS